MYWEINIQIRCSMNSISGVGSIPDWLLMISYWYFNMLMVVSLQIEWHYFSCHSLTHVAHIYFFPVYNSYMAEQTKNILNSLICCHCCEVNHSACKRTSDFIWVHRCPHPLCLRHPWTALPESTLPQTCSHPVCMFPPYVPPHCCHPPIASYMHL